MQLVYFQEIGLMHSSLSLKKNEKLCREKVIDQLFADGRSFTFFPLRVQFLITALPAPVPLQALFTVPKRRVKQAVKRNLLKRRMREAYRLNKSLLLPVLSRNDLQLAVAFIYIADDEAGFDSIQQAMVKALNRLVYQIEKSF